MMRLFSFIKPVWIQIRHQYFNGIEFVLIHYTTRHTINVFITGQYVLMFIH